MEMKEVEGQKGKEEDGKFVGSFCNISLNFGVIDVIIILISLGFLFFPRRFKNQLALFKIGLLWRLKTTHYY